MPTDCKVTRTRPTSHQASSSPRHRTSPSIRIVTGSSSFLRGRRLIHPERILAKDLRTAQRDTGTYQRPRRRRDLGRPTQSYSDALFAGATDKDLRADSYRYTNPGVL